MNVLQKLKDYEGVDMTPKEPDMELPFSRTATLEVTFEDFDRTKKAVSKEIVMTYDNGAYRADDVTFTDPTFNGQRITRVTVRSAGLPTCELPTGGHLACPAGGGELTIQFAKEGVFRIDV